MGWGIPTLRQMKGIKAAWQRQISEQEVIAKVLTAWLNQLEWNGRSLQNHRKLLEKANESFTENYIEKLPWCERCFKSDEKGTKESSCDRDMHHHGSSRLMFRRCSRAVIFQRLYIRVRRETFCTVFWEWRCHLWWRVDDFSQSFLLIGAGVHERIYCVRVHYQ